MFHFLFVVLFFHAVKRWLTPQLHSNVSQTIFDIFERVFCALSSKLLINSRWTDVITVTAFSNWRLVGMVERGNEVWYFPFLIFDLRKYYQEPIIIWTIFLRTIGKLCTPAPAPLSKESWPPCRPRTRGSPSGNESVTWSKAATPYPSRWGTCRTTVM